MNLNNTLTKDIEEFKPSNDKTVRLYTCGPTVYNNAHIGNLRSYIFADVLYRTLVYSKFDVDWVMNITDIDDKTIKGAVAKYGSEATVEDLRSYTDEYYQKFLLDLNEVNVSRSAIKFIKVTDVIPAIQQFIVNLINKGYAYTAEDGSTYFSIEKYQQDFSDYGKLVGDKFLEGKKVGARVKVDEYEKDNLSDFALWKAHDIADANIFWNHPTLGKGRPGWHIECSVINNIAFGNTSTDIHTGGVDLMFPHHTNEIAQSQPFYKPFSRYWFHSEHLLVDSKKMAKRANNFYTLEDLKRHSQNAGLSLRYLFLQSHYKTQQNFTMESMQAAQSGLENLKKEVAHLMVNANKTVGQVIKNLEYNYHGSKANAFQTFEAAINSDLDLPEALATLNLIIKSDQKESDRLATVLEMDKIFGLSLDKAEIEIEIDTTILPPDVQKLITQRDEARLNKDFASSDRLREELSHIGYAVKDTAEGQKIYKK